MSKMKDFGTISDIMFRIEKKLNWEKVERNNRAQLFEGLYTPVIRSMVSPDFRRDFIYF